MSMPGNNIPFHCDNTWEFDPSVVLVEGTVSDIFYPGDPNNLLSSSDTDGVIVYRVLVETKRPAGQAPIFPVTAANQLTGDPQFDQVDPIPVGTGVLVGFPEGDRNRGKIVDVDWGYDSALLEGGANQPITRWVRRGAEYHIDKDGNFSLHGASGRKLNLGAKEGDAGLRRLLTEDAITDLKTAMTSAAATAADAGVTAFVNALNALLTGAWITDNSTSEVKGK